MTCAWSWGMRPALSSVDVLAVRRAGIERDAGVQVLWSVRPAVRVLATMRVLQFARFCPALGAERDGEGCRHCDISEWISASARVRTCDEIDDETFSFLIVSRWAKTGIQGPRAQSGRVGCDASRWFGDTTHMHLRLKTLSNFSVVHSCFVFRCF